MSGQVLAGVRRGDIYWIEVLDIKGQEQSYIRPWLIVSGAAVHRFPIVIAVPMTSQVQKEQKFRGARILAREAKLLKTSDADSSSKFRMPLTGDGLILTEQVRVLSHMRLEGLRPVATLAADVMADVEAALAFVLDLT